MRWSMNESESVKSQPVTRINQTEHELGNVSSYCPKMISPIIWVFVMTTPAVSKGISARQKSKISIIFNGA